MSYRVIQWATGTVGVHAVPAIAAHPDLDLVGVWVHSEDKAGRDAGEVCGGDPVGVRFFHEVGVDYVSCSPYRVPVARLAAAHAALDLP